MFDRDWRDADALHFAPVPRGNWVKETVSGTTTVYIAGIYERQGTAYTSYYEGGGIRRSGYTSNNGVFYMLSDRWQG